MTREETLALLNNIHGSVSVVGSMNADYTVTTERLPGPGETVAGGPLQVLPGGKSGNQAAAAAKLGAANVTGTDIDPQAVESAAFNAEHNEVTAKFVLPGDLPADRYSLVVANILSNPLKVLAPALLGRVAPGGRLVLSGVLARQAEEVIEVYRKTDPNVELSVWREEDGWVCIAGQRHA